MKISNTLVFDVYLKITRRAIFSRLLNIIFDSYSLRFIFLKSNKLQSEVLNMIHNIQRDIHYLMSHSRATPLITQCLGPISLSKSMDPM